MKPFQIYRSSAGSGKTRTLAKFFLKLALENKTDYLRHILAVTFANKATAEMKGRIVEYLSKFSTGKEESLAANLRENWGWAGVNFHNVQRESSRRCFINFPILTLLR